MIKPLLVIMIIEINNIALKSTLVIFSLLFSLSAVSIELTEWKLIYTPNLVDGIPVISGITSYGLENNQNDFFDEAGNHTIKNHFSFQQRVVMLSLAGARYLHCASFKKNSTEREYPIVDVMQKNAVSFPAVCLSSHFFFFEPSLYARMNPVAKRTVIPDVITLVFKSLEGAYSKLQTSCPEVTVLMDPSGKRCEYQIELGKMATPFFLAIPRSYQLDHDESCITCYQSERQSLSDVLKQNTGRKKRGEACNSQKTIKRDPDRDIAFMVHYHPLSMQEPLCLSDIWMIDRGKPEVSASLVTAGMHPDQPREELNKKQQERPFQPCKVIEDTDTEDAASSRFSINKSVRESLMAVSEMNQDFWKLFDYVYSFEVEEKSINTETEAEEYLGTLCRLLTLRAKVKIPCISYGAKSQKERLLRKKIQEALCYLDKIILYSSTRVLLYYIPFTFEDMDDGDLQLVYVSVVAINKVKNNLHSLLTFYQLIKYPVKTVGEDDSEYIKICGFAQVYIQMLLSRSKIEDSDQKIWGEFKSFVSLCMQRNGALCDGALNTGFLIRLLYKASCLNDIEFILRVSGWIRATLHKIYFDPAAQQDAEEVYGRAWGVLKENKAFFTDCADGRGIFRLESFVSEAVRIGADVSEWQKVLAQWTQEQGSSAAQKATVKEPEQDIDALLAWLDIETEKLDIIRASRKNTRHSKKARKSSPRKKEVRKKVTNATDDTEVPSETHADSSINSPTDSQGEQLPEWEVECEKAASLVGSQVNNWAEAVLQFEKALEIAPGIYEKACIHSKWADSHFIPGERRLRSIYHQSKLSASYLERIQKAFHKKEYPAVKAEHLNKLAGDLVKGTTEFADSSQSACKHHLSAIALLSSLPMGVDDEKSTFCEASSLLALVIQQEQATRHIKQVLVQAIDNLTQAYQLRLDAIKQKRRLEPVRESEETKARKNLERARYTLTGSAPKTRAPSADKPVALNQTDYQPCYEQLDDALDKFKQAAQEADALQKNWEKAATVSGAVSSP